MSGAVIIVDVQYDFLSSPHTIHFREDGGTWPVHCVQGSHGAEFHKDLVLPSSTCIVTKGNSSKDEGYSAFEGELADGQTLTEALHAAQVTRVFVGGLATDYCVFRTVLDARKEEFEAVYLRDACRVVEVVRGDGERAEVRMLSFVPLGCVQGTVLDTRSTHL